MPMGEVYATRPARVNAAFASLARGADDRRVREYTNL